jgi:hypothetical protein
MKDKLIGFLAGILLAALVVILGIYHLRLKVLENFVNQVIQQSQKAAPRPPQAQP